MKNKKLVIKQLLKSKIEKIILIIHYQQYKNIYKKIVVQVLNFIIHKRINNKIFLH